VNEKCRRDRAERGATVQNDVRLRKGCLSARIRCGAVQLVGCRESVVNRVSGLAASCPFSAASFCEERVL